ncbi:uncharacterized protein isoform X1 [Leptinotarsa decemlineata]|uniref:uncharacterized protein isoform X1 n=1 Tax=Leptinotarsa decemlineata TaxID=7539 RepID=UPI003D3076AE
MSLVVAGTGLALISIIFAFRSNQWALLLRKIIALSEYGITTELKQTVRRCNILSKLCTGLCFLGTFIYILKAYYESFNCIQRNEEKGLNEICFVMMSAWLPFDLSTKGEVLLFALQALASCFATVPGLLIPFLNWEAAQLVCERIYHLKELSQIVLREKQPGKVGPKMRSWIGYHQKILEILEEQNYEAKFCLGHVSLIAALAIGCLINQAFNTNTWGALCEISGWMCCLFFLCDAGQKITDNTESIGEAIYAMKWYKTDIQTRKDLFFILRRTQKSMELDALPLGTLNYALYLTVIDDRENFIFIRNLAHPHHIMNYRMVCKRYRKISPNPFSV